MRFRGVTSRLVRWPVLLLVSVILLFELVLYTCIRLGVYLYERFFILSPRRRQLYTQLKQSTDFMTYVKYARELDHIEKRDLWKLENTSEYYDEKLISSTYHTLQEARKNMDFNLLFLRLKHIFSTSNFAGINNPHLYCETYFGTKLIIHDFLQEVLECLIFIKDFPDEQILPLTVRKEFFKKSKKWYGRTALLLSGGAANGYFHIGVIKTLLEAKCLPSILSGASAGSLIASYISVRTDEQVLKGLCTPDSYKLFTACDEPFLVKAKRFFQKGYMFDVDRWIVKMKRDITDGDTTFLEAYKRTGRVLNVAVTGTSHYSPSVVLNYRTAPDVVIWSAVIASSAFPNIIRPVELLYKHYDTQQASTTSTSTSTPSYTLKPFLVHGSTFADGSLKHDIPWNSLSKLFGTNFHIVCQVNPHAVPFFYNQRGSTGKPSLHTVGSQRRGGYILSMLEKYLKLDMRKYLVLLSDLDLLPRLFGQDWRDIFTQILTGTLTIVPNIPLWAYFRILSDPTYDNMKVYIQEGQRATFPKLCRIANHFRLEKTIQECEQEIEKRMLKQKQATQSNQHANTSNAKHKSTSRHTSAARSSNSITATTSTATVNPATSTSTSALHHPSDQFIDSPESSPNTSPRLEAQSVPENTPLLANATSPTETDTDQPHSQSPSKQEGVMTSAQGEDDEHTNQDSTSSNEVDLLLSTSHLSSNFYANEPQEKQWCWRRGQDTESDDTDADDAD